MKSAERGGKKWPFITYLIFIQDEERKIDQLQKLYRNQILKNISIKNKHLTFELTLYFLLQNLRYDEYLVFLWNNLIPTQLTCNSNTIYGIIAFYTIFESMTTLFRNSFDVSKSSRKYVNLILSTTGSTYPFSCIMREIIL